MNRLRKEYSKGRTGSDRAGVGGLHRIRTRTEENTHCDGMNRVRVLHNVREGKEGS
jgi:hypothetical protein